MTFNLPTDHDFDTFMVKMQKLGWRETIAKVTSYPIEGWHRCHLLRKGDRKVMVLKFTNYYRVETCC